MHKKAEDQKNTFKTNKKTKGEEITMRINLAIPVIAIAAAISTTAIAAIGISSGTRADMLVAMKDEAYSYLRYMMCAEQARANGNTALAQLFEDTAAVEFHKHFRKLASDYALIKGDVENVSAAIGSEFSETRKMYLDMSKRAEAAGDKDMAETFAAIAQDEEGHQKAFLGAMGKKYSKTAN
jgi:rubrerythrin